MEVRKYTKEEEIKAQQRNITRKDNPNLELLQSNYSNYIKLL